MTNLINGLGGVAGFGENSLTRNDDSFTSNVSITSVFGAGGLNFFGINYTTISINNNGNITFGSGGLSTYTPFGMQTGGYPIIAPFFADVDTRGGSSSIIGPNVVTPTPGGTSQGSNIVYYDFNATGFGTLTVTWDDVGYFSSKTDKLNAFQLQLVGTGSGNFDAIFRYEAINWTTGSASGGVGGLGGTVARAGYSTGNGTSWYELAQSGIQDQMLSLETTAGNTGVAGYYKFSVRSGTNAPETLNGTAYDDILAGAGGDDILNGYAGNDSLDGSLGADKLVGGLGNDRYVVDNVADWVVEALNQGIDTVQTGMSYTLEANVENLLLTGTATINGTGNALDNVLTGNSANNVLNGLGGLDTVSYATYSSGLTIDLSLTTAQWLNGQDTLLNIENCIGTINNDTLRGNSAANVLDGNLGADNMSGGLGNDTYVVNIAPDPAGFESGDVITELAGQGTDTVNSSVSWVLGANLENLVLAGTGAINGTGNALNNVLYANTANNVLNGGAGIDTVVYLLGATTAGVSVGLVSTVPQATGGSGSDTLLNIENLTGSSYNDRLSGNAANNVINGGAGIDVLDGGLGNDILIGGLGNDTYVINVLTDVVSELAGQGADLIMSGISYNLTDTDGGGANGGNVENLRLTGTTAINATGNALDNVLYANTGNNVLDGGVGNDTVSYLFGASAGVTVNLTSASGGSGSDTLLNIENLIGSAFADSLAGNAAANILNGGVGIDTMAGGLGNDTYYVDNLADVTTETSTLATEIDTVLSSVGRTLGANLERLTLIGTAAVNGTGNTLANVIIGNAAANSLSGGAGNDILIGGVGKDTLTGGTGNDSFDFNALSELGLGVTRDLISDFTRTQDKIDLSTIDANASLVGDQAFTFVSAFTATAGQARYSGGIVYLNTDADATSEYEIQLTGIVPASLAATDFVL